ncbi:N,N-dimethylformamidase beta subunit family domain-containing protein [Actinomadura roseirufa]|uniref:N,N-dimethylformamidase beta subunit family domain-containing protein n=1 Tax=Actinomadura roseirufa TaxID=2094049 RepID=UPI001A955267|nr:N,N-dimethylformamidase beta subunit family domain-containing protein [Actinomadura roseirufa]
MSAENGRPGTADWRIRKEGAEHEIEGYADHVSVLPGEAFRLFVSTTTAGFTAEAFRMGWYGGEQARRVWRSERAPGARQAAAVIDRKTRSVSAPWKPSLTVHTPGWPAGAYLIRLTAASGAQRYVPLTVRSENAAGAVVVMNETTTWQAYNMWGGYDLYKGPSGGETDRATAVSFDRPYDGNGAGKFMTYEQPAIALAEKLGVPLAYTTNNDLHARPGLLDGARGLLTLGHDEYWSTVMRKGVTRARDRGLNIAFLGANAVNRHIRFGPTPLGANRLVTCYKDAATDPVSRTDPAESTQDWRLPPQPRPESELIGIQYSCFPAEGAFTVGRPDFWMFRGTGVRKGTSFPGVIGPEADSVNAAGPTPRPIEIVARSQIVCGNRGAIAHASYYTTKSGAGVFATGTMRWVCAMRGRACGHGVTDAARPFVTKSTETLVRAMAAGPMGRAHPAQDNLDLFQSVD